MSNDKLIWNKLIAAGLTPAGAAGLLGNLYAESGLNPRNLQNSYERKLGLSDADYTAAVDCGAYHDFFPTGRATGWPSGPTPAERPRCWSMPGPGGAPSVTWTRR